MFAKKDFKILDMLFVTHEKDTEETGSSPEIISIKVLLKHEGFADFVELMESIRGINGVLSVNRV